MGIRPQPIPSETQHQKRCSSETLCRGHRPNHRPTPGRQPKASASFLVDPAHVASWDRALDTLVLGDHKVLGSHLTVVPRSSQRPEVRSSASGRSRAPHAPCPRFPAGKLLGAYDYARNPNGVRRVHPSPSNGTPNLKAVRIALYAASSNSKTSS